MLLTIARPQDSAPYSEYRACIICNLRVHVGTFSRGSYTLYSRLHCTNGLLKALGSGSFPHRPLLNQSNPSLHVTICQHSFSAACCHLPLRPLVARLNNACLSTLYLYPLYISWLIYPPSHRHDSLTATCDFDRYQFPIPCAPSPAIGILSCHPT